MGIFYFFAFAGLGASFPFLPLLLSSKGLDARRVSWVMAVFPTGNLLVPPLWGSVADTLAARRGNAQPRLSLLTVAVAASGLTILLFWPAQSLAALFGAMAAHCLFRSPLASLSDAITTALLGDRRERYAHVRIFGSLGFAAAVLCVGQLGGSTRVVLLAGTSCAVYLAAASATLRPKLRAGTAQPHATAHIGEASAARDEKPALRGVAARGLRDPTLLLLLAGNATYYAGHAAYDAFFSLHLGALSFGDDFVGVAWMIGVMVEVGLMALAPPLMKHSATLLPLCGVAAVGRWLLLSTLRAKLPLAALVQPLHGLTFGVWYLSMVKEVQDQAPPALRATYQSLAAAAQGLGMVVGYIAGGSLFARGGGRLLFRTGAGAAALGTLLYAARLPLARRGASDG